MTVEPMTIVSPDKRYESDGQLIFSCQYHVIFCTKYRRKVLINNIDVRIKELIEDIQQEYNYKVIDIEVMSDHVHLLLSVSPKTGIYTVISKIKGHTSRILRKEFPELVSKLPTLWTRSRFISSVGVVSLDIVKKYIENQKSV